MTFSDQGQIANQEPEFYSCSVQDSTTLCLKIYHKSDLSVTLDPGPIDVEIQQLMVLPNVVYDCASNSCEKALNGECHWIPYSAITGEKCIDCPPICRGKQQTLLFPLFVIGMALLILSSPVMWIPTIALTNNQSPPSFQVNCIILSPIAIYIYMYICERIYMQLTYSQAIILAGINSVNVFGQGIGPIIGKNELVYYYIIILLLQ